MTRQRQHAILVDGEPGWIRRADPLRRVVWRRGLPASTRGSTGVSAGYTARWSVSDGRLWLVAILDPDNEVWPAAMTHLFGDRQPPILAEWFSGRIVAEFGEPVGTSLWGPLASTLEVSLIVKRGVVTASRRREPSPRTLLARGVAFWSLPVLFYGSLLIAALLTVC